MSKETIITLIGEAKQGKTHFLSTLTGVNEWEFPDFLPLLVHNSQENNGRSVWTKLTWYTEEEMLQRVKALIQQIVPDHPAGKNLQYEEIPYLDVEQFCLYKGQNPFPKEELRQIVNALFGEKDKCAADLIGKPPTIITDLDEMQSYFHQSDFWDKKRGKERWYGGYWAVKQVDLYCPFRNDVGPVCITDQAHHSYEGWHFPKEMGDAVIVVKKPYGDARAEDFDLYEALCSHHVGREKLFYLANRNGDYNKHEARKYADSVRNTFQVADCQTVDVSNQDEAEAYLESVLKAIGKNN